MSRSEKYARTPKENWTIAILVVISLIAAFSYMPGISEYWEGSHRNKLFIIGLITFMFLGSLWNYSKPYWRLRDRMVDSVTDGTYDNKKSNLRALGLGFIVVLAGFALIILYVLNST